MSKVSSKIRFKGFDGDWEVKTLGDITNIITKGTTPFDKSGIGDINFVKVENIKANTGKITITSRINRSEHEGYLKRSQLQKNDILFSIAGTLGRVTSVDNSILPANTNQALAIIRLKEGDLNFIITTLKSESVAKYIRRNPTVGAQPNLSLSQISNLNVKYPNQSEQQKIGTFFKQLDDTIAVQQQLVEQQQQYKKAMLQKMFPQKGESAPKVRFEGFSGEWEDLKIRDVGTVVMCKRIFKDQTSSTGDIPFYKIGTFGGDADSFIPRELFTEYKQKHPYPEKGDILISASGTIGRTVVYKGNDEYFQDSNIIWLKRNKEKVVNSFLKQFYKIVDWGSFEGSTIKRLYNSNILSTDISLPSLEEQQKIGSFFKQLDDTIDLHQKKLEDYQQLKKALLQRMFL